MSSDAAHGAPTAPGDPTAAGSPTTRLGRAQIRLTLSTVGLGTFIEWFEYASYAYLATTIATVFFPSADGSVALMQTFGVFALSFLVRPLGGLFWGHFGDRIGPKRTLTLTIVGMGVATFAIGVLPGYASIGIAAPLLLLVARMLQSFCAAASTRARRSCWRSTLRRTSGPAGSRRSRSRPPRASSGPPWWRRSSTACCPPRPCRSGAGGSRSSPPRC